MAERAGPNSGGRPFSQFAPVIFVARSFAREFRGNVNLIGALGMSPLLGSSFDEDAATKRQLRKTMSKKRKGISRGRTREGILRQFRVRKWENGRDRDFGFLGNVLGRIN